MREGRGALYLLAAAVLLGNGLLALCLPMVVLGPSVRGGTAADWGVGVAFGVLVGALAWSCFARGIRTTSSLNANFIAMVEPVLAPVWTFLLLRERMSGWSAAGCVVVLGTLALYYRGGGTQEESLPEGSR